VAAPIIQKIILDLASAEAQLNALEARVEKPVDVPIRLDGGAKLDAARESLGLMADDARAVGSATEGLDDQFRLISQSLGVSESDARDLAQSIGTAEIRSGQLDEELKSVARAMGLSDTEAAKFSREMRKAEGATDKAADEAKRLARETDKVGAGGNIGKLRGQLLGLAAAFGVGIGVQGAISGFRNAIDSATALGESVNAVNVVFKDGAPAILAFGENAARSVGLANSELNQLVTPIGALLGNFNIDGQAAADVTLELTNRAADLASVFNTEVPDALAAIGSALRGEQEPIRAYGVSLDEAAVAQKALSLGLADTASALTPAAKGQARLQLILEQSAFAAGDFANTSDDAANKTKILAAEAENARASLGDSLLPAYESLLAVVPDLIGGLESLAPLFGVVASGAAGAVGPVVEVVGVLGDLVGLLGKLPGAGEGGDFGWAKTLGEFATGPIVLGLSKAIGAFKDLRSEVETSINPDVFIAEVERMQKKIQVGAEPIDALAVAFEELQEPGRNAAKVVGDLAEALGVADADLRVFISGLLRGKGDVELTAAEIETLKEALAGLSPGSGSNEIRDMWRAYYTGADRTAESLMGVTNAGADRALLNLATGIDTVTEASGALPPYIGSLGDLQGAADDAGQGLIDFYNAARDSDDIRLDLSGPETELLGLIETLDTVSAAIREKIGSSFGIEGFLDEESGTILDDTTAFLTGLKDDINDQTDFEIDLSKIRLVAPDLAAALADQGIDVAGDIAASFAADDAASAKAQELLDGTAEELATGTAKAFAESLKGLPGEQVAELEVFAAENFISPKILQDLAGTGESLADDLAGFITDALSGTTIAPNLLIDLSQAQIDLATLPAFAGSTIPGATPPVTTQPPATTGTGQPGGPGDIKQNSVVVNINNPEVRDLDTSAAQAGQTIDAVTRNLWRGSAN